MCVEAMTLGDLAVEVDGIGRAGAVRTAWGEESAADEIKVDAAAVGSAQPRHFGEKRIGLLASFALVTNNIMGPGAPNLPNMFVESGWLLPIICLVVVWLLTSMSASMLCEAMAKMPGNANFAGRAEYTSVVRHYFGQRWYVAAQIALNGALQCQSIICVIQSSLVMDTAISFVFGRTCGLNLTPFANMHTGSDGDARKVPGSDSFLSCTDMEQLESGNPWGCHVVRD